jgi:hypothetical protein
MDRRMRAKWVAAAAVLAVGAGGYYLVKSGRAPPLAKTLQAVASSAEALASAYVPLATDSPEAGADADAGEILHRQAGPLSNAQLGAPLVHGTFVSECGAPDTMHVTVKASVKFGRAVSVDVKTTPPDTKIAACIDRAVKARQWDVSPKPGKVTVTY